MYEDIFQVKSNDLAPEPGKILIASPLLNDYHFQRTVTMMISHNEDNDIGLVINKEFRTQMYLNELIRELKDVPKIPLFKGGPVDRYNLTFIHNIEEIDKSIPLENGLFINGNINQMIEYIKKGNPIEGRARFYLGLAGWEKGQLMNEINENYWIVSNPIKDLVFSNEMSEMWKTSLDVMGEPYRTWAKYPLMPSMN